MYIETIYDIDNGTLEGITFTNLQHGKGYVYFQQLDLVLLVRADSLTFVPKGTQVNVTFIPPHHEGRGEEVLAKDGDSKYPKERLEELQDKHFLLPMAKFVKTAFGSNLRQENRELKRENHKLRQDLLEMQQLLKEKKS